MTIDCADPHGLAQFWAQALDGTLGDPEGNELCVERSQAERIATGNA
ncbi:hypothetical protein ACFVHI_19750 [Kitasatospora sp. NPDC127121]